MHTITIHFSDAMRGKQVVKADEGEILLQVLLRNGIDIRHDCGGVCTCTTCHVYVTKGMAILNSPSRREQHLLERKAIAATAASRLSCQCVVLKGKESLELFIPDQTGIPIPATKLTI